LLGGFVVNWSEHVKNRNAVPIEQLLPYENQHVAWSADGTHIIAGDTDPLRLVARLKEAGVGPEDCVLSLVDFVGSECPAWFDEDIEEGLLPSH
jgi:hypothetical protein